MEEEVIDESFFTDIEQDSSENIDLRKTGYENLFNERQVGSIAIPVEPISSRATLDVVLQRFDEEPGLEALPVEDNDRVIGVLERKTVEDRTDSALKRFVAKTCGEYVRESQLTLNCSDYLEKVSAKVNAVAIKEEVKYFVALINNRSYYGIVPVAKINEKLEELRNQDLEKAGTIQQNILKANSETGNFPFYVSIWNKMANQVGGDFYVAKDFGEGKFLAGCFDVSGKNVSAALLTVTLGSIFSMFKFFDSSKLSSAKIISNIDSFLQDIVPVGNFITGAVCYIDVRKNIAELYNCGHTNCFVCFKNENSKGKVANLKPTFPPFGMGQIAKTLSEGGKGVYRMPINPGLQINLYSDGLTDMQNDDGERFDEVRTKEYFLKLFATDVDEFKSTTDKTIKDWVHNSLLPDDITIMNIRF